MTWLLVVALVLVVVWAFARRRVLGPARNHSELFIRKGTTL